MSAVFSVGMRIIVWLLIGLALVTAATLGYARMRGLEVLSVQTGSMRPAILPGDAVMVRPLHSPQSLSGLTPGEVITYRRADNPRITLTHRIIAVDTSAGRVIAQGDALDDPDPPVAASQIVGQVVHRVPAVGCTFDFLKHPAGLLALIYMPAAVLIGGELRRLTGAFAGRRYHLYAYR